MAEWLDVRHGADIDVVLKRLGALVFAIALVTGAFAFRNWRASGGTVSLTGGAMSVVCDESIAAACREVFDVVRSVEPGDTFDELLIGNDGDPFVWIAADIWFDMLDDERGRNPQAARLGERSDDLAHSPLVFAGPGVPACDPPDFACLADPSVDADVGIDDRRDSSTGLVAFGQLAFERNRRSNADLRWSESDGIELAEDDTQTLLSYRNAVGRYDLVVVTRSAFDTLGPDDIAVESADPAVAITIGAVVVGDGDLPGLGDIVEELIATGWTAGPAPTFERPSAGGLIALRPS